MAKTLIQDIAGWSFWGCPCVEQWWPLVQKLALKRGLVRQKLDVSQGGYNKGGVAASAGTHDGGGVLDLRQYSEPVVLLLREAGAAAWHRRPPHFSHHTHLVLVGCPHASAGAKRQVESYRAGRDGLAMNGPDDGPQVYPIRSWSQGVAWMRAQLDPLTDAPTPDQPEQGETTPSPEEDDMATIDSISDAAADKIGRYVAKHLAEQTVHAAVESVSDSAANKLARTNATVSFGGEKVGEAIIEIAANTRKEDQ